MKRIIFMVLVFFLLVASAYAAGVRDNETQWWTLKNHWDNCKTKDHKFDLEYMSRVMFYNYVIAHPNPIRKIAILPPPARDEATIRALGYFQRDVLHNTEEMTKEYLIPPKKWTVVKDLADSYPILKDKDLYDKYAAWIEEFVSYRRIDKGLISKMGEALDADTLLLLLIGHDRPGAAAAQPKSESYLEPRSPLLNVYLFDAKSGKIIWEYGCEFFGPGIYAVANWRGFYRYVYKSMPVE